MTHPAPGSAEEKAAFAALSDKLRGHFRSFRDDPQQPYTAVIVPSQSVDPRELAKIQGGVHYEERSLFNLMLLRRPRMKVVFVTSKRLHPAIVDYTLHQMRGVPRDHALSRLALLDCDDASPRPLTQKILERPAVLERIRRAIDDPERAHLGVFTSTPLERTLAVRLGIPLNASEPDLVHHGNKTGSRRVFREAGVPMAAGFEGLSDWRELVLATAELATEHPLLRRAVVKLNSSFSGEGNGTVELDPHREPDGRLTLDGAARALDQLRLEAPTPLEEYQAQFASMGGIVEAFLEGDGKSSPSAQIRINPLGEAHPVSTHDQVLGGPSGQVFQGCTFPAHPSVRLEVQRLGLLVGDALAQKGVIGRLGVDFIALQGPDGPRLFALEINLRQGGTTHPFNTLKFLTGGRYDKDTGRFFTTQGQERTYFATDTLCDPRFRGILPADLIDRAVFDGLHIRPDETGVVFHLLGCLSEHGKLGCTAIAPDLEQARALYERTVASLTALGQAS